MPHKDKKEKYASEQRWRRHNKERVRSNQREWYADNKAAVYFSQIKQLYGITLDEYATLDEDQNWVCAICEQSNRLSVDHNHITGRVRGLLCTRCNLEVGKLEKDLDLTHKRLAYLEGAEL